jgi:hypothetical protein
LAQWIGVLSHGELTGDD